MIKCINCGNDNRDTDRYCRNCGIKIRTNGYYIILNILTVLFIIALILTVILLIASYIVK